MRTCAMIDRLRLVVTLWYPVASALLSGLGRPIPIRG